MVDWSDNDATPITTPEVVSNSYASVAEGDAYVISYVIDQDVWDDATDTQKQVALNKSTERIDRLNVKGERYDEDQTLQFPRGTDTEVPDEIKNACILIAFALLDGINIEFELMNLGIISEGLASVRTVHDRSFTPDWLVAGIPSKEAWDLLLPYLREGRSLTVSRV